MDAPEISVVVLAYQSSETITGFIDSLVDSLENEKWLWEIILVGNYFEGIGDQTPEVVRNIAAKDSRIKAVVEIKEGGYLIYDSSWKREFGRDDINIVEIPLTKLCVQEFSNPKQRLLFKNLGYVGLLASILEMDKEIYISLIEEQFRGKDVYWINRKKDWNDKRIF